jgi:hypothetical protein
LISFLILILCIKKQYHQLTKTSLRYWFIFSLELKKLNLCEPGVNVTVEKMVECYEGVWLGSTSIQSSWRTIQPLVLSQIADLPIGMIGIYCGWTKLNPTNISPQFWNALLPHFHLTIFMHWPGFFYLTYLLSSICLKLSSFLVQQSKYDLFIHQYLIISQTKKIAILMF